MSTYRFINRFERRLLWSIVFVEHMLIILTWYYMEIVHVNNECYKTLRRDSDLISSFRINVPHYCTWQNLLWFRINLYTIYGIYFMFLYLLYGYYISGCHLFVNTFIEVIFFNKSFLFQNLPDEQQDHIIYRHIPVLFHALIIVLNLENQPFWDSDMENPRIKIKKENDERLFAKERAIDRCWKEVISQIRHCNQADKIRKIIRERDEEEEKILARYQLLDYPPSPSQEKKTNRSLTIFIHIATFFLLVLAIRNCIFLFRESLRYSFHERIN